MDKLRQWHRWFGMCWTDFFTGTPVTVEMEKDLSLQKQFLDVVVVRKGAAAWPADLPDGFDDLADHNLISFKSYQETLDAFALRELDGHYVNYRKQVSPDKDDLIPEDRFRLFAVSVRRPAGLIERANLEGVAAGVYRARLFGDEVRVVVVHELPRTANNAMLHLFSYQAALVEYGQRHYRQRSERTSTFLGHCWAATGRRDSCRSPSRKACARPSNTFWIRCPSRSASRPSPSRSSSKHSRSRSCPPKPGPN